MQLAKHINREDALIAGLADEAFDAILERRDPAWGAVARTPFLRSERLSALAGCDLWIKYENLQPTGAFKERGALAKLLSLDDGSRSRGVIAASAGNHAQGLARHAGLLGIEATIVMPRHTPYVKIEQTEKFGARVILDGDDFDAAKRRAEALCESEGLIFVHPFDDPHVIAGQGTVAAEMLDDVSDLDVIVAPIGGGGLLSGIAAAAARRGAQCAVLGVQTLLYPSMYNAVKGDSRAVGGTTLAEGIAVREPGALTRDIIARLVDDIMLVDERSLERALSLYLNVQKVLSEGAGAAGLAAILDHPERFRGKKVGTVICGGNIDTRLLSSILMRDLARQGRIARLRIELLDVPGQLTRISDIIASQGANVIDVAYHKIFSDLPAKVTYIDISVETHDRRHLDRLITELKSRGVNVEIAAY
ncbi:MAG: threonine ammonia-lyase [Parvularculaceae bacterium]